jgi:hypothetical protein
MSLELRPNTVIWGREARTWIILAVLALLTSLSRPEASLSIAGQPEPEPRCAASQNYGNQATRPRLWDENDTGFRPRVPGMEQIFKSEHERK